MLLRLVPNEHISLSFPKQLDIDSSNLSKLQYMGFDGSNYHFVNTSTEDFTVKFVFTDQSELVVPIEVYNKSWQMCSPFELTISRMLENVSLSVVNWYNDFFFRYYTPNNIITFTNNVSDTLYRVVVGGRRCNFEHIDVHGNNLSTIYIDDTRSRFSFILKPSEKLVATVNYDVIFRVEKAVV